MKITGYSPVHPSGGVKKTGKTSPVSSFADVLAASGTDDIAPSLASGEVSATSLSNLLSLQEVSDEDLRRQKLAQQGNRLLDTLEQLRQRILTGAVPPHLLRTLSQHLSVQKQSVNDPRLMELIDDIELRAAVELAKLERAADPN